jgi:hypothetical protein
LLHFLCAVARNPQPPAARTTLVVIQLFRPNKGAGGSNSGAVRRFFFSFFARSPIAYLTSSLVWDFVRVRMRLLHGASLAAFGTNILLPGRFNANGVTDLSQSLAPPLSSLHSQRVICRTKSISRRRRPPAMDRPSFSSSWLRQGHNGSPSAKAVACPALTFSWSMPMATAT